MRSRSTREGTVGLLILLGFITLGTAIFWLKGARFGRTSYQIIVNFPQAPGISVGSAVLYRGVEVGRVVDLQAQTNGVKAILEINSSELRMPPDLLIEPGRYGLIGEAIIEINPKTLVPDNLGTMTAVSDDCNSQIIACDQDSFQGQDAPQLLTTLARLGEIYGDPEFYENFIGATKSIANASDEITALIQDVSDLTKKVEKDLTQFTDNANQITDSVVQTANDVNDLTNELLDVSQNINSLVKNNNESITRTIRSINQSSDELALLIQEVRPAVANINDSLAKSNLTELINNLETITANLREFSNQFNNDSNVLVIQETLDSARATFANAEKITADLDQLTGDPQFRNNVKKLVDGLSELVSSQEQLEKQVQNAQVLNAFTEKVDQQIQLIETSNQVNKLILIKPLKS